MLNVTSRLAIRVLYVPDDVDWLDHSPQSSRRQLTAADILPDADDAHALRERALIYLQHFLTTEFDDLHDLQQLLPPAHASASAMQTEVVPMKILFHDEKYVAENVAILGDIAKDASLTGSDQVATTHSILH